MTTAHRPTFDPARGKEALKGPAYHQRLMPAHTFLKTRKAGQGGDADPSSQDLKAQLLEAEAAHYSKRSSGVEPVQTSNKRPLRVESTENTTTNRIHTEDDEDVEAKRRRIVEETREIDAASDSDEEGVDNESNSEDSSEDEEDETAELLRELEKIKRERAAKKQAEDEAREAEEQEQRESDIAYGNPLLNPNKNAEGKRRWDDDVIFRNQARGTEQKGKPEFVNDLLRSDFHKRFMSKYVR